MTDVAKKTRRVRPLLLILLWIWAGVVFLVLDLFLNVSELDGFRPRAPLYRGMRMAAHQMVGEPYQDELSYRSSPSRVARAATEYDTGRLVRFCKQAGKGDVPELRNLALSGKDPVVAGLAIRALARLGAVTADASLLALVDDSRLRVRQEMVIALGTSRDSAMVSRLAQVLAGKDPAVRPLAVQSLGQIGVAQATRCLERVVGDPESGRVERLVARTALAQARSQPVLK